MRGKEAIMAKSPWSVPQEVREQRRKAAECEQCGKPLGFQMILGPVCGACCRVNHRHVTGRA